MADISFLGRLINGAVRNVDLPANTPVVLSIKIGGVSNTELTKTLLDSLLAIRTDLASNANGLGASLVGIEDAGTLYTATNVESALAEVKGVADSAASDASSALSEADDLVTLSGRPANSTDLGTFTGSTIPDSSTIKSALQSLETSLEALPDPMEYKGNWAASTNTPSLADGVGNNGDVYYVTDDGDVDFGAGSISFKQGDRVVYSGADSEWQKWDTTDQVSSVFGRSGAVTAQSGDYNTSQVTENTNLYFTDSRAKTAAVVNSLAGSQTDQAPSVSAVNAALGAISTGSLVESLPAGESFSSGALRAVRWAKAADAGFTAGRVYKAAKDASSADNFWVQGLVLPGGAITAGQNMTVYKAGMMTATGHGFTVGEPIFLGAAGALSNTPPTPGSVEASVVVGFARDANTIEVQINVMGVA